ncbi:MAG: hypothetical protein IKU15_06715 [Clostridia bacterium]|nr:hypothetical protein [Clostridia bacterium]
MKKALSLVLALVCTLLLFAGCSKYQPTDLENVSMKITDASSTGATLTIKDSNEEKYVYGEWYKIVKVEDGNWIELETLVGRIAFNELAYVPDSHGEVKFVIDWAATYGELPAGTYRLMKDVNSRYISAEFVVE